MESYKTAFEWCPLPDSPDMPLFKVFEPRKKIHILKNSLDEALVTPIGSNPLAVLVRIKQPKRVLILVDDLTRPTPQKEILPKVLILLKKEGINQDRIKIMIAVGLHRAMNEEEIEERFGKEIASSYCIKNHDAFDVRNLVNIGISSDETPILVNKEVPESDFIIAIGQIAPHRVVGFSGGAKIIQPGVCGEVTTASIHWRGWSAESKSIFAVKDNPIRDEIVEIGNQVDLNFVINVVMDEDGVIRYYCGDHYKAYEAACDDIISNYSVDIPESSIVIADAAPSDFDIWQAAKALSVAELVLKKHGTVILLASCPDGWSMHKDAILKTGYHRIGVIVEQVELKKIDKIIGCHFMAFGRVLDGGKIIIVSEHLKKEDVEMANLIYAETLEEAVKIALIDNQDTNEIIVLKQACKIVPHKIMEGNNGY